MLELIHRDWKGVGAPIGITLCPGNSSQAAPALVLLWTQLENPNPCGWPQIYGAGFYGRGWWGQRAQGDFGETQGGDNPLQPLL